MWPPPAGRVASARKPALARELFVAREDQRTAVLTLTLGPVVRRPSRPWSTFFVLQPLIEAATAGLHRVRRAAGSAAGAGVRRGGGRRSPGSRGAKTRIYAQRLSADGRRLRGPAVILENDQPWEGTHRGVWIHRRAALPPALRRQRLLDRVLRHRRGRGGRSDGPVPQAVGGLPELQRGMVGARAPVRAVGADGATTWSCTPSARGG